MNINIERMAELVIKYIKQLSRLWRKVIMKLNHDKLLKSMNEKWVTKQCPMCGKNNWNIDTTIQGLNRLDANGSLCLGGATMPVVAVTCMNCGNTIFINPLVIECIDDGE